MKNKLLGLKYPITQVDKPENEPVAVKLITKVWDLENIAGFAVKIGNSNEDTLTVVSYGKANKLIEDNANDTYKGLIVI